MRFFFIIFILAVLAIMAACSTILKNAKLKEAEVTEAKASYTDISPQEAKKRLESDKTIILLDVRTVEENLEKRIPNSVLIPVDVIDKEAEKRLPDKDAEIFVYCRSGRRSVIAAKSLVRMGYTRVYNLGGINDWPYETESGK
ncbi:MAG: rhodanese-like domain-containing protein [Clostridia bacterium]|nr:rhodanese-like domain-containing protein [Clostridia bacterium]